MRDRGKNGLSSETVTELRARLERDLRRIRKRGWALFDRENVTLVELLTAAECDGTTLGLFLKMKQKWIRTTRVWYLSNGSASGPNCCRATLLFRAEKGNQKLMGLTKIIRITWKFTLMTIHFFILVLKFRNTINYK